MKNNELCPWVNHGDVNYIAYGGCLVSKHFSDEEVKNYPTLRSIYDVFSLDTEAGENGDQLSAALYCVDIDDIDSRMKEDILTVMGAEQLIPIPKSAVMSETQWAKEMVECGFGGQARSYRMQYPSSWEDYILTEEELKFWLKNLGAEKFVA